jgi:cobalt-precorrin-7 (C5)-methyltransferase
MPLWLIGTGPGDADYLTPIAKKKIEGSDLLVGSERALRIVEELWKGKRRLTFDAQNLEEVIRLAVESSKRVEVAILSTGDPCFSGLLKTLKRVGSISELRVIPGISSVQVLSSRLGLSWDEFEFVNFHNGEGSIEDLASVIKRGKRAMVFPGPHFSPCNIAKLLMEKGVDGSTRSLLGIDLTYPTERIMEGNLRAFADKPEPYGAIEVMAILPSDKGRKTGVVLLGHGSRLSYNASVIGEIERDLGKEYEVITANLRNPSTLRDAILGLNKMCVERIVVVPVFIARGAHTEKDLPGLIASIQSEKKVSVSKPLCPHPLISEIVRERIREVEAEEEETEVERR